MSTPEDHEKLIVRCAVKDAIDAGCRFQILYRGEMDRKDRTDVDEITNLILRPGGAHLILFHRRTGKGLGWIAVKSGLGPYVILNYSEGVRGIVTNALGLARDWKRELFAAQKREAEVEAIYQEERIAMGL